MKQSPLFEMQLRDHPDLVATPSYGSTWSVIEQYQAGPDAWRTEYDASLHAPGASLIDRSYKSALRIVGRDRQTFLQGLVSNDVAKLVPGQGCRAALLDNKGRVLAGTTVHCLADSLILETDPQCALVLLDTLDEYLIMEDAEIVDESDQWVALGLVGAGAIDVAESVFDVQGLSSLGPLDHKVLSGAFTNGFVTVTYTAPVLGLEAWLPVSAAMRAWQELSARATATGSVADNTFRVESGQLLWGGDIYTGLLLPELDRSEWISYSKGCYVGQEIVARLHSRGHTNRALRQLLWEDGSATPSIGDVLYGSQPKSGSIQDIGFVTSVVVSPRHDDRVLGLGYVRKEVLDLNTGVSWIDPNTGRSFVVQIL